MKRVAPKDLFIIHTKATKLDRMLVDSLAGQLLLLGFTVWGYSDWNWQVKVREKPSWEDDISTYGFLDPDKELEALNGPPMRTPRPVDRNVLDHILLKTRAVIFLNPSRRRLSDGMREELASLRRLQLLRRHYEHRSFPPPVCLWWTLADDTRDPYPLNTFGDGDLTWAAKVPMQPQDAATSIDCLMAMVAAVSSLLLEQRAAFVRTLAAKPRNTGALSQCFCSAVDEVSRCSQVLEVLQPFLGRVTTLEPLPLYADALANFCGRYTSDDLDWARWANWRA